MKIIVVNPELEVKHGDYAIVKVGDSGETTLKRVEFYENTVVLRAINPSYFPIQVKDGMKKIKIIGKVVSKEREYK